MKKYTIDATGRSVGRVASEAATLLMGKKEIDFARHQLPNVSVEVAGVNKLKVSDKKIGAKTYKNYSGYPGGLKTIAMSKLIEQKGMKEVLRKAVYGMLPKNKLRSKMIKQLTITE